MTSPLFTDTYDIISRQAELTPDAVAIEAPGYSALTYAGLRWNTHQVIRRLRAAGIQRTDRVALVLPNGPEMAICLLGISAVAVCAPLNSQYQGAEYVTYLTDLDAKLLITQGDNDAPACWAARVRGIPVLELSALGLMMIPPNPCPSDVSAETAIPDSGASADDIALVLHTSGTTSRPKIVPLTHRNLCVATDYVCQTLELGPHDRCLSMMPQFHIGGFVDLLLSPLASGGRVLCTSGFDADQFFVLQKRYRPTWYQAVPTTLALLLRHAKEKRITENTSSLRLIRSVAAPLSPQLMRELESFFGVPVIVTFGMTEAAPLITSNPLPPAHRKTGSAGKTVGPEIGIVDTLGNRLPAGAAGEIIVRGANLTAGYENDPRANAKAFRNNWFHTGDEGYLDEDGYLFLTGRLKEMINRGGEKLSPLEIDDVLLEHPAVAEAMTFAVPHDILGEDVAAAVVCMKGASLSSQELTEFAAERLAPFKIPRTICFTTAIPRGPTGKPQRIGAAERLGLIAGNREKRGFVAPRNPIEKQLADLWGKALQLNEIGIHDNFFDLGGDSLQAMTLATAIEETFRLKFPLNMIFRFHSIEKQARLVDGNQSEARQAFKGGSEIQQVPLYWILCVFDPGNIPLFPLETYFEKGPDHEVSGVSIEELAAGYITEIRRHSSKGPYSIGGYSIGGLIAIEIARQLREAGEEVPLLFALDPPIVNRNSASTGTGIRLANFAKRLSQLTLTDKLAFVKRVVFHYLSLCDPGVREWSCRTRFLLKKPLTRSLRKYYAQKIYTEAASRYQPPGYSGRTTICLRGKHPALADGYWRAFSPNANIIVLDTSEHDEVQKPPWNLVWLKALHEQLAESADIGSKRFSSQTVVGEEPRSPSP